MKVKVRSGREDLDLDLSEGATSEDIVKALCLHPDAHLIVRDNSPIPIDEPLREGDHIRLIRVASGG